LKNQTQQPPTIAGHMDVDGNFIPYGNPDSYIQTRDLTNVPAYGGSKKRRKTRKYKKGKSRKLRKSRHSKLIN
jgi:hypothetical protein